MEFKTQSTKVSYEDFLLWFGISSLEQTKEKSFLLDQRTIQVAEIMQSYRKKIWPLDSSAEDLLTEKGKSGCDWMRNVFTIVQPW